jgi:hypothetical protein
MTKVSAGAHMAGIGMAQAAQATTAMGAAQTQTIDPLDSLLSNAMHEIRYLRHKNEILEAKVQMIDLFSTILFSQAPPRGGEASGPDVSFALERKIRELQEQRANAKP